MEEENPQSDNSRRGIFLNLHNNTNIIISVNNTINGTFESNIYSSNDIEKEKQREIEKN